MSARAPRPRPRPVGRSPASSGEATPTHPPSRAPSNRNTPSRARRARPGTGPDRALQPVSRPHPIPMDRVDATAFRKALTEPSVTASVPEGDLQPLRLDQSELDCIAELAFEYVTSGADEVARVLYAGLVALEPRQPHHRLGLGLALDHLGHAEAAERQYSVAAELAPSDPTPLVNLAELAIQRQDTRKARSLLERALDRCGADSEIRRKSRALLSILDVRERRPQ